MFHYSYYYLISKFAPPPPCVLTPHGYHLLENVFPTPVYSPPFFVCDPRALVNASLWKISIDLDSCGFGPGKELESQNKLTKLKKEKYGP